MSVVEQIRSRLRPPHTSELLQQSADDVVSDPAKRRTLKLLGRAGMIALIYPQVDIPLTLASANALLHGKDFYDRYQAPIDWFLNPHHPEQYSIMQARAAIGYGELLKGTVISCGDSFVKGDHGGLGKIVQQKMEAGTEGGQIEFIGKYAESGKTTKDIIRQLKNPATFIDLLGKSNITIILHVGGNNLLQAFGEAEIEQVIQSAVENIDTMPQGISGALSPDIFKWYTSASKILRKTRDSISEMGSDVGEIFDLFHNYKGLGIDIKRVIVATLTDLQYAEFIKIKRSSGAEIDVPVYGNPNRQKVASLMAEHISAMNVKVASEKAEKMGFAVACGNMLRSPDINKREKVWGMHPSPDAQKYMAEIILATMIAPTGNESLKNYLDRRTQLLQKHTLVK